MKTFMQIIIENEDSPREVAKRNLQNNIAKQWLDERNAQMDYLLNILKNL